MKSLNAKRIAAVAASVLMGVAVAGQGVTFGNIPIINSAGQPVVQIVVGGTAQPSDGVVAANIAAAIGSLAHTTQNITARVRFPPTMKLEDERPVASVFTGGLKLYMVQFCPSIVKDVWVAAPLV